MDYRRIYNQLMEQARRRSKPLGYVERHHVQPRAFQGSNDPENLVWLTAREHFVAHRLLAKIYGGKMEYALIMMSRYGRYTSWVYEGLKKLHQEHVRRRQLGVARSPETKRKISQANRGRKLSAQTRARMSAKRASEETRLKMSQSTLSKVSVMQMSRQGQVLDVYPSIAAAAQATNIFRSSITAAAKGRRPSAGGYLWRYGE